MNLVQAIIEKVRPAGGIPVYSGSPKSQNYPVVLVDIFGEPPVDQTLKEDTTSERLIQVTVAALDPVQAETIGVEIAAKLKPSTGPIAWDSGRPGREMTRWNSDTREREQVESAPDGGTIYYYETDTIMLIQRWDA